MARRPSTLAGDMSLSAKPSPTAGAGRGEPPDPSRKTMCEARRLRLKRQQEHSSQAEEKGLSKSAVDKPATGSWTELRNEVKAMAVKFRQVMVSNAGLDNDKSALMYQMEALRDHLEEVQGQLCQVQKAARLRSADLHLLQRSTADSHAQIMLLQHQLRDQNQLLEQRGLVLVGGSGLDDGHDDNVEEEAAETKAIVSLRTAQILSTLGKGPLHVRVRRLVNEKNDLQDQVRRLKMDLEEGKHRSMEGRTWWPSEEPRAAATAKAAVMEHKFRLQKSEQELATLQAKLARLETQVLRFRTAAESAERSEEQLKRERRTMQRELRDSATRIEELETANKHLESRLFKLKTAKSNLLKDL